MVHERGESAFVGIWGDSAVASTFGLEVTTVCDLFDRQLRRGHSHTDPGYYGTTTEPGRLVIDGVPHPDGQERIGGYRNRPDGKVWWEVATSRRMR